MTAKMSSIEMTGRSRGIEIVQILRQKLAPSISAAS